MDDDQHHPLRLSVIVPVYNGAATLGTQLDALTAEPHDGTWEIVVVDNDSTDSTPRMAASYADRFPHVRVVEARDQHNLSYVRNAGVRAAHGRAVAFCDDDDVIAPGWVAAMTEALERHALVGSRLEYGRLGPTTTGRAAFQSRRISRFFGLPNVAGAGSGCQRWLWEALGGNDETWDDTGEDFDFSFRAHLEHGVDPHFAGDAVYHYRRRGGVRASFRQARRYGRSHVRLYERYGRPEHRTPTWQAIRSDAVWLLRVWHLMVPGRRDVWGYKVGLRLGRAEASIRRRVLFL